jgi:hypothetical protein
MTMDDALRVSLRLVDDGGGGGACSAAAVAVVVGAIAVALACRLLAG